MCESRCSKRPIAANFFHGAKSVLYCRLYCCLGLFDDDLATLGSEQVICSVKSGFLKVVSSSGIFNLDMDTCCSIKIILDDTQGFTRYAIMGRKLSELASAPSTDQITCLATLEVGSSTLDSPGA